MSLADLALDYVAHLEHHLKQLLEGQSIKYSGMPWPPADPTASGPSSTHSIVLYLRCADKSSQCEIR